MTVAAGATIELGGGSIIVELRRGSTEEAPVTFTSSFVPAAGDWACITFSSASTTLSFDHAVFEYAGRGHVCSGAEYQAALHDAGLRERLGPKSGGMVSC